MPTTKWQKKVYNINILGLNCKKKILEFCFTKFAFFWCLNSERKSKVQTWAQPLPGKKKAEFRRAATLYCFKWRTYQGFTSVKFFYYIRVEYLAYFLYDQLRMRDQRDLQSIVAFGHDPFNQIFRTFLCNTEWIGSNNRKSFIEVDHFSWLDRSDSFLIPVPRCSVFSSATVHEGK